MSARHAPSEPPPNEAWSLPTEGGAAPARMPYVAPKLVWLGSVRDLTFGATGQRADLRGGLRPRP